VGFIATKTKGLGSQILAELQHLEPGCTVGSTTVENISGGVYSVKTAILQRKKFI
jgi:hypothetical protein